MKKPVAQEKEAQVETKNKLTCGIIMPIAGMGADYSADHWVDVKKILETAIIKAGFEPRIVSDSEESTVIHGSIINIYNDAIVVCDVSGKNANVMFELGMRLAFDKPVVIVKDDKTDYSFDTGNIQHEPYRRDLRHSTVEKFINDLARKIKKTYEASLKSDYPSFLSYFGKFKVATIEDKPIGEGEAIEKLLNKMNSMESKVNTLIHKDENDLTYLTPGRAANSNQITVFGPKLSSEQVEKVIRDILAKGGVEQVETSIEGKQLKVIVYFNHPVNASRKKFYEDAIGEIIDNYYLPF